MAERPVATLNQADVALEMTLRPSLFSDFTGQPRVKERLEIAVAAARQRGEALDHILLNGPPGLGKTTLANILAKAMGAGLKSTSGPTIEKAADLAGLLTNLEEGDVLFIDEIHRLQKTIEEYLYPAMEDFKLDIIIDQGPNARSVRLNLPRFTLIGRPPAAASSPRRCSPASPSASGWIITSARNWKPSSSAPPTCSTCGGCRRGARIARRSRGTRASPTTCSAGCAITPRSRATAGSPPPLPTPRWPCWRLTRTGWTKWTSAFWRPSS